MGDSLQVLHAYRTYFPDPPGGLQEAIRQICLATQQRNVRNTIFTLSPNPVPPILERPEAKVVRYRSWAAPASCDLGGFSAFHSFSKLARGVDVLHYHFPWPFADLLHLLPGKNTPALMTYHSDVVRQRWLGAVYAPLMWQMLKRMRIIVTTSPAYAKSSPILSDRAVRDKVRVIPLGIDEHSYPAQGDEAVFDRIGLPQSEPYFLFVGVLRYYKGLHVLVQAASRVGARIVIAGSGPERQRLESLVSQHGVRNVVFAGQVSDAEKVSLIKGCRGLVLPSHLRSEAFGMVLVEAAMFGRPLISCEIGTGTSYVNAHEQSGFVVPPEDPDRLAEAMNTLLNEEALAGRMGQGARARYEAKFSAPALGQAYEQLYRELAW